MAKFRLLTLGILVACQGGPPRATADDGVKPSERPATVRVAGIVLKWIRGEKSANFRRVEPLIREAAVNGAQLVCTTECFLDGYAIADKSIPLDTYRALGELIPDGQYFRRLAALADELDIHLVAGMLEADGPERYNTAVVIGPDGGLVGKYRKQRLGHEVVRNTAGSESSVFETLYGRLGVMICADRRDPELVSRFCGRGADFLLCPSGGMFGPQSNDPILQARSRETGRHIVFVHPAEFLVTGPEGAILRRELVGDRLLVPAPSAGKEEDSQGVFYFDVPVAEAGLLSADSSPNSAKPSSVDPAEAPTRVRAWLDEHIPTYMAECGMPGFSIAVVQDGRTIYAQGFGWRDPERDLPATADTLYGIGSLTKSFVAVGIMQLVEGGQVGLDDPVSRHVPLELGIPGKPITIHHLLTHTPGVPSLASSSVALSRGLGKDTGVPLAGAADFYRFVNGARDEVVAEPGQRYFYHNAGWRMLAHIIQEKSGLPFHRYLAEQIIQPLGMQRTTFIVKDFLADPDHSVFHLRRSGRRSEPAPFPYPDPEDNPEFSFLSGAGGVISSVNEMTHYLNAHLEQGRIESGRLASETSFQTMHTLHVRLPDGYYGEAGYGYGWNVTPDFLGHKLVSHGGSIIVSTAHIAFLPELEAGVVMMGNSSGMPHSTIAESVLALLLGHDPGDAVPSVRIKERMRALCGEFETYRGLERLQVLARRGMLYLETQDRFDDTSTVTPLIPDDPRLGSTTFYTLDDGLKSPVEFRRYDDGRVDLFIGRYCYHKRR